MEGVCTNKESDPNPYTLSRTPAGKKLPGNTLTKQYTHNTHRSTACQTRKYLNNFSPIISCTRNQRFTFFLVADALGWALPTHMRSMKRRQCSPCSVRSPKQVASTKRHRRVRRVALWLVREWRPSDEIQPVSSEPQEEKVKARELRASVFRNP